MGTLRIRMAGIELVGASISGARCGTGVPGSLRSPGLRHIAHNHGAGLSIAISASTSMRSRITAAWSPLTSTSGTSGFVL
jgi:hypothetical protein